MIQFIGGSNRRYRVALNRLDLTKVPVPWPGPPGE